MSKLWTQILKTFNYIGDNSGCHQIPERSFKINGYIFPICARCTGVVLGQFISLILLLFNIKLSLTISIVLLLIMGIDWFIQFIGVLYSNNTRRFITGILGGFAIVNIYYYIIVGILHLFNINI